MTQLLTETKHPSARCQVMAPSSGEQNCGSPMKHYNYVHGTRAVVRSGYLRVRWHVPGTYPCGGTLRVPTRAVVRAGYLLVRWYVPGTYSCDGTFRVPTHEVVRPGYLPVRWYMPSVCPISCSSSVTYASRLYLIFSSAYARDVHSELYSANATKLFASKNVSKLTMKRDEIQRDSTIFNDASP